MSAAPRSKYRAVPTVVDGIRFQSAAEARHYGELKLLQRAKKITGLVCHPVFILSVQHYQGGPSVEIGKYVADFEYFDKLNGYTVSDVKGVSTSLYKWKKKHFEIQYGIKITEVR